MTIFELGALGEFIGALAVLVTLIYLAMQIKQNTNSMNESRKVILAQSRNELARGVQEILISQSQSIPLAEVISRSIQGEQLTPTQAIMNFSRNEAIFRNWENANYQYRQGLYDEEEFSAHLETMRALLSLDPGMKAFWGDNKSWFSPRFAEEIDKLAIN